jgi:hypothetical protein
MLGTFHFALPDELTAGQRRTLRTSDDSLSSTGRRNAV